MLRVQTSQSFAFKTFTTENRNNIVQTYSSTEITSEKSLCMVLPFSFLKIKGMLLNTASSSTPLPPTHS